MSARLSELDCTERGHARIRARSHVHPFRTMGTCSVHSSVRRSSAHFGLSSTGSNQHPRANEIHVTVESSCIHTFLTVCVCSLTRACELNYVKQ